ncbi:MAG: Gfo/Idh/MocA family oxidoreductase [Pseudomonadota bacterium]|nr:Gfo/Idh/MocA family oxidoreductase [Pseudomonadota bacterium]
MQVRVLVVGLGNMGLSHARAYHSIEGFEIAGLCSRDVAARPEIAAEFPGVPQFDDYARALAAVRPDAVSINTWPDTHAAFARAALAANAHVFIEKPLAQTVAEAEEIVALAQAARRKLMIGYILRVHPSWAKFVEIGRTLGKPLVMRMNLNQQSSGAQWATHKKLMETVSPIVDCGVHYVDVMCQVTGARPLRVHALGARLSQDIAPTMYNYGCLQVAFDDGSVGWYEAGWGPMMSETAFFVKDMIGPNGAVSIAVNESATASSDIDSHTKTNALRLHHARLDGDGRLAARDEILAMEDEPGHQELCNREQRAFLKAIRDDEDLTEHARGAIDSLRIVLAADESIRTGKVVALA